jgi:hypothetical protein
MRESIDFIKRAPYVGDDFCRNVDIDFGSLAAVSVKNSLSTISASGLAFTLTLDKHSSMVNANSVFKFKIQIHYKKKSPFLQPKVFKFSK